MTIERLDKILSHMGYGSRKDVRALLKQKKVTINGELVSEHGKRIDPLHDMIHVAGELVRYRRFIYVMLNKPKGVISATEDLRERTVIDLLEQSLQHFKPFPVGRLDKDTTGLLLLTNDGQLAHQLLSPRKEVNKVYYVELDGKLEEQDRIAFQQGVVLDDGYVTRPAKLDMIESGERSKAYVTIVEGKFHQVKRMFKQINKNVTTLKRMSMGPLCLDPNLDLGTYRELTDQEIQQLWDEVT